ncbi:hypothetical protein PV11_09066 [Exophiala sideris]|uniref:Uncharacterized protein n=1 Tax=Exophiala sideris TaxID=1016849 RepID=A0A0D1YQH4_9EURO|nr:hypothetical protein PV11_09066 [Exophiala sideris]
MSAHDFTDHGTALAGPLLLPQYADRTSTRPTIWLDATTYSEPAAATHLAAQTGTKRQRTTSLEESAVRGHLHWVAREATNGIAANVATDRTTTSSS